MKQIFIFLLTLILLCLLSVPLLVLILLQLCILGRPIFFRQKRAGLKGHPFTIIKFRTMRDGTGSDAERLTKWGKLLRSSSLDELPELWNVLKGEMSLVGPRPLPVAYLNRYNEEQSRRHEVLPGITGWAQVNGRNGLSWERQFELDLWYVENQSLLLDIKILCLTIMTVLWRENINAPNEATRSEFTGSPQETNIDQNQSNDGIN